MGALQRLIKFVEKGARNNANDASMIQTMHDHSVELGATCSVNEAAGFAQSDVMTLLNAAVKKQFKNQYSYPYLQDVYDDYLVFTADYSSATCYRCDYNVTSDGSVTLGTPVAVVRKVTYIEPSTPAIESDGEIELTGDCVQLVENVDNSDETPLTEAKTRIVKLIAPGWGSSGFYSEAVLKRDGPKVFKKGTHNFIDHPTAIEEKERPEGSLNKLASVLTEDAVWHDDYKGNGAGLYAKTRISDTFEPFLNEFGADIGMSIRASGKVKIGEADGKKGPIVEAITAAKSVDYVTLAGAGGKVLELFESAKNNGSIVDVVIKEKEVPTMATDQEFTALQETVTNMSAMIARLTETQVLQQAREYAARKLANPAIKLHAMTKERILSNVVVGTPLNEKGAVDYTAFDALIEAAVTAEAVYLTSVGAFGQIRGFGASQPTGTTPVETLADLEKMFNESMIALDND